MSWGKIDDGFHAHLKAKRVSLAAVGLWAKGLSWTAANELDGFIPLDMLPVLANGEDFAPLVAELTHAPDPYESALWEIAQNGYQMHDYFQCNPSAKFLRKKRRIHAKNQENHKRRKQKTLTDQRERSASTGRDGTGEPSESSSSSGRGSRGKPWRVVPAGEALTEQRLRFGTVTGLAPDIVREQWARFADHEFQAPRRDVDRTWRNWLREAKRREEQGALRLVPLRRSREDETVAGVEAWLAGRREGRA